MKLWPTIRKWDVYILLGISIIYFATRLYQLTALPIFVDEAIYSRWAQISLHDASWRFISLTDGKQPLFVWAAMPFLHFIENPLFATRAVSVVSGWLTVLGLVYAGYLLKDKRTGYIAATLAVLTPFLFFYDRFAVMESMLTAAGIWLFNFAWLLAKTRRLDIALLLGMGAGLALLIKSPAQIYLLLIPAAFIFLKRDSKRLSLKEISQYLALLAVVWMLAEIINNIQRLSPWMYMISRKNGDFVISPLAMITEHPYRIWQNFMDSQRWLIGYLTWPLYLTTIVGAIRMMKEWRNFLLVSAWVWAPMFALVTTALLYRPRYLVFITPFLLLYAARAFSDKLKPQLALLCVLAILPARFMYLSYVSPLTMPLIQADKDYVSGWAAGNGVKEIGEYLTERALGGQEIIVGTEGTFGLLPHGLELYTDGIPNLKITGYYPINKIPPGELAGQLGEGREVYFILNNTQVTSTPPGLIEVASYKKADDSWIRLYRLLGDQ